jgi:uncharacterized protein (AIM24 family)
MLDAEDKMPGNNKKKSAAADEATNQIVPTPVEPTDKQESPDPPSAVSGPATVGPAKKPGLRAWAATYWSHKRWTLPATVLIGILLVLVVPSSRYAVLGIALKEPLQVTVVDSSTNTPISGVHLQAGAIWATTSAKGTATLRLPVGTTSVTVSKQYYKNVSSRVLVSYSKDKNTLQVRLLATGRLVPITVINKLTGKPVAGAEIKVLHTDAKTNDKGQAIIALPLSRSTQSGTVTADNYNQTGVTIQITGQTVPANTYALTPTGKVYFLSNLSGKIDVVKTNLDGTDRQTVLAGTGNESSTNTVLLVSRDWKYLALLTQRKAGGNPELDLIDTTDGDKLSNIDEGNANFTLVGWDGDRFVYQVTRNNVSAWQNGQQALKSFNAPSKSLTVLAQTTADGNSQYYYIGQQFGNTYIVNNRVVYVTNWNYSSTYIWQQNNKAASVNSINADGSGSTVVKAFGNISNLELQPYDRPDSLSVSYWDGSGSVYYEYHDGQVTLASGSNTQSSYDAAYSTYLLSPSGNQTFWAVPTDGKGNLFVGDTNGGNGKKIATLSDYSPYGWYTDSYLLVSKNGSELYAMPANGGTPVRISDYYKPSQFFRGYGGGYGGL